MTTSGSTGAHHHHVAEAESQTFLHDASTLHYRVTPAQTPLGDISRERERELLDISTYLPDLPLRLSSFQAVNRCHYSGFRGKAALVAVGPCRHVAKKRRYRSGELHVVPRAEMCKSIYSGVISPYRSRRPRSGERGMALSARSWSTNAMMMLRNTVADDSMATQDL